MDAAKIHSPIARRVRRAARPALVIAMLAVLLGALAPAGTADAHRNDESYLYLDVGDSTLSGRVEMPYRDLRQVFGFTIAGSPDEVLAEFESRLSELQAYADGTTSIGIEGRRWPLAFDGVELLFPDDDVGENGLGYVVLPFDVDMDVAEVPQIIEISFNPFLEEIPNRNNIALVSNDWKRGVVEEETNELLIVTQSNPSGTIDLGDSNQLRNFTSSIGLGVDHIRTGPDHIFFILVLLLPAVLVLSAGRWHPTDSFRKSLWRVVVVATMFTISHSITFTLAGLDLIPLPPSKLVETLIAASIAAAALHNLRPIFGHREWAIAFGFGLFHGMGFAGLVAELDINRTTQLVSLLGRNLGIEIGQIVIILITFPMLFLLRRTRAYLPLMYAGSILLAVLAGAWMIERIWETDLNVNGLIDSAILWPRSLVVVIVLTVVAWLYRRSEESNDRLLPVYSDDDGPTADDLDDDVEPALV